MVSVVVPVLDEEECVEELVQRVREAMRKAGVRGEILIVDDGSRDRTPERIVALRNEDPAVKSIRFTRPFGHQAALAAGLAHASGDAVVSMDGDLQHPPELLPELIAAWRNGHDVVNTERRELGGGGRFKRATGTVFYRLMSLLTDVPVVARGADYRLLDRSVVDRFNSLQEHFLFVRGMVPWLGFPATTIPYTVAPRFAGRSKYTVFRMTRLALNGVFSFSVLPLRMISLLGLATTLLGIAYGGFALWAFLTGNVSGPRGWTSLMGAILIFGGVQLLSLGIVSEYIGRVYEEVKRRPRYVIESSHGVEVR